jgi:hypothetical protein
MPASESRAYSPRAGALLPLGKPALAAGRPGAILAALLGAVMVLVPFLSALLGGCTAFEFVPGKGQDVDDEGGNALRDDDGTSTSDADDEEEDLTQVDADADGLNAQEELDLGTSDDNADSDGDGYLDPWEVAEGTDPTDAASVIYAGGWPYNPDKDSYVDPGWDSRSKKGNPLPAFAWHDQFGETVDIRDFYNETTPIALDVSGVWCYWCNELAALLEGEQSDLSGYGWESVAEGIADGKIYWITALDAGGGGQTDPVTDKDLSKWYRAYPSPDIPILGDTEQQLIGWMGGNGYPTVILLNPDLTVWNRDDLYTNQLDILVDYIEGT